jgi:hypothetical protein
MNFKLVVVHRFGTHVVGDVITSAAEISQVLASEHAEYVVRAANGIEQKEG